MQFRWIAWNRDHIDEHGVDPLEAESVVRNAVRPFPIKIEDDKWLVHGRGIGGRFLQVIYLVDPDKPVLLSMRDPSPRGKRGGCEGGGKNERKETIETLLANDDGGASRSHEAIR